MRTITLWHLSITGMVLTVASAITAALPKNDRGKAYGELWITSDGFELTCGLGGFADRCTYTATLPDNVGFCGVGSRTSTNNGPGQNDSSSISTTWCGNTVNSLTEDQWGFKVYELHTSRAPF